VNSTRDPPGIHCRAAWLRLLLGLSLVFGLFQWSASALGSDRGQAGIVVGALIVAAAIAVERALFGHRLLIAARALGLGRPRTRGLVVACAVSLLLFLVVLVFVGVTGGQVSFFPDWMSLLTGLFAQAGVAEETLFRGYLFRHLRVTRTFWRAAVLSMLPFTGVHLILFLTMPWPVALIAVLLAIVLSFPLAYLFELGGNTIWAPALLHFVIQGTIKILTVSNGDSSLFPVVWMAASAVLPLLSFAIVRPTTRQSSAHVESA